ncbi:MAG: GEVED domain-containing protein, partial [Flavobacteriales bacterium]
GNNLNATSTGDFGPDYPFDPLPTVWHAFTTTECANVTVSYCATAPAFENVYIFLSGDCPANADLVIGTYSLEICPGNVVVYYTNLPAGTWYLPVLLDVVNNAAGDYSITVSAEECSYCDAYAENTSAVFEKISNVTFAGIDNSSTSPSGYEDFTALSASVVAGVGYPLSITVSNPWSTDQVLVWIDWDQSTTFDSNELVYASTVGTGPFAGTVTVPLTALPGPTRMRVRLHDTATPNDTPCGPSSFGQVEDYTVDVIGIITGVGRAEEPVLTVRPNPSDGDMVIEAGDLRGVVRVEVLDATGRVAWSEQRAMAQGAPVELALRGRLAPGTYLLRLFNEAQRMEQRIVVH